MPVAKNGQNLIVNEEKPRIFRGFLSIKTALRKLLGLNFSDSVTLFELVYASARIYEFLFSRKIRMALIADIDLYGIAFFGRTGSERISARTNDRYIVIIRMDLGFHQYSPLFQ